METAVIAVIGTLLGSVVTHFFQGRAAHRAAALHGAGQLHGRRATARQALVCVQPVCDDPETVERATGAFEVTHRMHEARDEAERERRSEAAVAAPAALIEASIIEAAFIEAAFIEAAAPSVR
ncbi:hypothetical protein [Streptomyces lavendofoliae]|uniref:hypothetical protein n=1 Tax=Streptomyces lavendofoliae TaxID=67314 RepID=UPI003D946EBE